MPSSGSSPPTIGDLLVRHNLGSAHLWLLDVEEAKSPHRKRAERDRHQEYNLLLQEELRIKDAPHGQHSSPSPPLLPSHGTSGDPRIKAARCWSLEQTAKTFFVCPKTIASWMKRLDEDGASALVQLPVPVNKFPDFVRYAVKRLQTLCPNFGKKKLSEVLARAGLHWEPRPSGVSAGKGHLFSQKNPKP